MFTEKALLKAKIDLYNIVANLAYRDYCCMRQKHKNNRSYNLFNDTEEALEVYKLVYGKTPHDITVEEEKKIKAFLLKYRLLFPEYLKEAGGRQYYGVREEV